KARNAGLPRIVLRHAVDFRVDDVFGDLDAHVFARLVDVDEFSFHLLVRCGPPARCALPWTLLLRRCVHSEARRRAPPSEGVRKEGLEPSWVAPPDPKSGASASSATFA